MNPRTTPRHTDTDTGAHPARPARRGRGRRIVRRVLIGLTVGVVALVLAGVGSWLYETRAQGTPQAVEFDDAQLSPTLAGATVLALGEATHGNAEYQDLRTAVLRKTVDQGFRTVVLEEDFGATREVDAYVQGGPGTAQEAAQRFGFRINKTAQVASWLQWMREHNASVPPEQRIHLRGMDVQRTDPSLRLVADALAKADPAAAKAARAAMGEKPLDAALVTRLQKAVAALPRSPLNDDARTAVIALADNRALAEAGGRYALVRDTAMFAHLTRIVDAAPGKVLLLGHDGHVAKAPAGALTETVGHLASQKWGDRYRVIGTDFHRTRFLSGQGEERREWSLTNRTPLRGIYAGTRVGYVEFAQATPENRALVDTVQPMGSAGEAFTRIQQLVPFMHTAFAAPSSLYDALILVDDATPVTML